MRNAGSEVHHKDSFESFRRSIPSSTLSSVFRMLGQVARNTRSRLAVSGANQHPPVEDSGASSLTASRMSIRKCCDLRFFLRSKTPPQAAPEGGRPRNDPPCRESEVVSRPTPPCAFPPLDEDSSGVWETLQKIGGRIGEEAKRKEEGRRAESL